MLAEMTAGQPSRGGSRPVPIGSRSIGVSLQPAIPRRVAPQQSPLPLHQSPTILAQSPSGEAITYAARFHWGRARRPVANGECHLYFARSVSFLYCSDTSGANLALDTGPEPPRLLRFTRNDGQRAVIARSGATKQSRRGSMTGTIRVVPTTRAGDASAIDRLGPNASALPAPGRRRRSDRAAPRRRRGRLGQA